MRLTALLLFALFLFAGWLSACTGAPQEASDSTGQAPEGQAAQIIDVIDGDTVDVVIAGEQFRVRYVGVDTPERDEPFYAEARDYNRQLLQDAEVILVKDVSETDRFGRLLRFVYLPDGTFVNAELIRQGYGKIITIPPDVSQHELFLTNQQEAQRAGLGLWATGDNQSLPTGCLTCESNKHNCGDFGSQSAAQACYEACLDMTGEDIHRLDGGGDGQVCESLP